VRKTQPLLLMLALCLALAAPSLAADRLRLATTTSTEATGLLDVLLPPFEKAHGIKVDVLSVGTGKALALGRRCDVDVVLVHAPKLEEAYVKQGSGVDRRRVMHNFFVIVGPPGDPAQVGQAEDAAQGFRRIARAKAAFVSRGDKSGTNVKELAIWKAAGVIPEWPGYQEAGRGMGAVLTMAGEKQAYTLCDVGTFRAYKAKGRLGLVQLLSGDPLLKNPYSVIRVNPQNCLQVNAAAAEKFADYLVSPQGQTVIKNFKADGKQLFWPDASSR